jgi:predicted CXXCH cytochrome family protein
MNEPPTEKSQKACPPTCEPDENDCVCVADKQKKSCHDLHGSSERNLLECLTKPAAAHILEECPSKKNKPIPTPAPTSS